MAQRNPRVGLGVFVFGATGAFIMGKRKGSLGAGTWALPGGHLDFGESFEQCARRETLEETGLAIDKIRFLTATNSVLEKEQKHYITIFMVAEVSGEKREPELIEPDKCEGWEWVQWPQMKQWAREQGKRNGDQEGEGEDRDTWNGRESESRYATAVSHAESNRQLFLPLLNLLQDRPEAIPSLSTGE